MADHALYLEIDEDITSAIDKLRKAPGPSVQIVVPKRSGILQSIINLKLLKKAANDAGKQLVLVTNDKVAGDLAGRIGIPVAASIGSRPVINEPARPQPKNNIDEIIDANDPAPEAQLIDLEDGNANATSATTKRPAFSRRDIDKPRTASVVDGTTAISSVEDTEVATPIRAVGASKVPSFTKLQRRLSWVSLAILLIISYFAGMYFFASSDVKIFALGTKINVEGNFVADPAAVKSDPSNAILSAKEIVFSKDATAQVIPTGQKDNGTQSSGTAVFKNCEDSNVYPLAAGNTITSQGLSFTTNEAIVIPAGTFTGGGTNCTSPSVSVKVTASKNGDTYNITNASFASPKLTSNFKITAAQMSGGTSKITTIITQADVDTAQAGLIAKDKESSAAALNAKVPSDSQALPDSIVQSVSGVTSTPAVGEEAKTANVTMKISYTTLTIIKADYKNLVNTVEQKQIGEKSQIYDDGIATAKISANGKDSAGRPSFSFNALAYGGAKLDKTVIANKLKGMKYGEAITYAGDLPGVDHVEINVWPAWSTSLPKRPTRIRVTVTVANSKG